MTDEPTDTDETRPEWADELIEKTTELRDAVEDLADLLIEDADDDRQATKEALRR